MSPMTVTFRVPKAPAPIPWIRRKIRSSSKLRAKAHSPGDAEEEEGGRQDLLPPVAVGEDAEDGSERDAGQGEDRDQEPNLPARHAEGVPDLRQRRGDAGDAEDGHERDPEEDVEVVVPVDFANPALVLRRRRHEGRMYQAGTGRARTRAHLALEGAPVLLARGVVAGADEAEDVGDPACAGEVLVGLCVGRGG